MTCETHSKKLTTITSRLCFGFVLFSLSLIAVKVPRRTSHINSIRCVQMSANSSNLMCIILRKVNHHWLLWFLSALVVNGAVAGNPDAKRLYDDLLSNYNKLVRPVVNTSDVLRVCIKLKLSQLIDVVSFTLYFYFFCFSSQINLISLVSVELFSAAVSRVGSTGAEQSCN